MNKAIVLTGLMPKPMKRRGMFHTPSAGGYLHAEVVTGVSIRIHGNHNGVDYDRYFHVGKPAQYDSYNLIRFGEITGITGKTVSITSNKGERNEKTHRMSLYDFSCHNKQFSLARAAINNHEAMQSI